MLVSASVYKEQIEKEFKKIQYTDKYLWYTGSIDNYDMEVKTEGDKFAFAIVEPITKELIGYVSFRVDWYCSMAYNFSLIRFMNDKYTQYPYIDIPVMPVMVSAIREVIKMIESFNLHRIDFRCVSGNPAQRNYDKLLQLIFKQKKYATRIIEFTDNIKDTHGNYHNTICYELIRREKNDF